MHTRLMVMSACLLSATVPAWADEQSTFRELVVLPAGTEINGDYFAAGRKVEISGRVKGDVYAAGGEVLVDGTIEGDLLAVGGKITMAGTIAQDIRVAGGQVTIGGQVTRNATIAGGDVLLSESARIGGSLVAAGGNVQVAAPVGRDAKLAGGNVMVSNRITGNVRIAAGAVRLTSKAGIGGDFKYRSSGPASIDEQATVGGRTIHEPLPEPLAADSAAAFMRRVRLLAIGISAVSTLILGVLLLHLYPVVSRRVMAALSERPAASIGFGAGALVTVPVIAALLMATVLAIPVGLVLIALYLIYAYLARICVIAWVGQALWGRIGRDPRPVLPFVIGLGLYYLAAIVPVVGSIVGLLSIVWGMGAVLLVKRDVYVELKRQDLV